MTLDEVVIDASALMAFLMDEPGGDAVAPYLEVAQICSINFHECIYSLMSKYHASLEQANARLTQTSLVVHDYTPHLAVIAASLQPQADKLGLSLGDRACVATALELGLPVVTADKIWKKLKLDIPIICVR